MIPRYRAWGRDGNYPGTPSEKFEMFYDVSVVTTHQDKVQHVIADFGMYNESEYNGTEIIDYTLMQSTGLFDKNGKEIFEGDILCDEGLEQEDEFVYVTVSYKDGMWICYQITNDDFGYGGSLNEFAGDYSVIGNIYQNKELLEVKK